MLSRTTPFSRIYGLFAIVGLFVVMRRLPETKGRSQEELEARLVVRASFTIGRVL